MMTFIILFNCKLLASDVGTLYDVYEKTFTYADKTNLNDVEKSSLEFKVDFTNGNAKITMPGYWAGGNTWKIRFAPTLTGNWSWKVLEPGYKFVEATTGTLTVTTGVNKGFLHSKPDKPYTLEYSDGTPVFVWGSTAYLLLEQHLEGNEFNWHHFVAQTKSHGMNKIRLLITMWGWGNTYSNRWYPWSGCSVANPHYDAFNISYWNALDDVVKYLQDNNILAELILFPDTNDPTFATTDPGMGNMTLPDEKRYIKYAIARYASYSNVIWCLANEWGANSRSRFSEAAPDLNNTGNFIYHPDVINLWGNFVKNTDPYVNECGRLLSCHQKQTKLSADSLSLVTNWLFDFWNDAWPTHGVLQMNSKLKGHDLGNEVIIQNWGHRKPVFDDEYGYEENGRSQAMIRKMGWGIAIAGGYGSYGQWNRKNRERRGSLFGIWYDCPGQDDLKAMLTIMRSVNYSNMSQMNSLIITRPSDSYAYLYADVGREYLMYVADGGYTGEYTISVPAGKYEFSWYHTTSTTFWLAGSVYSGANGSGTRTTSNGMITLTAPGFETDTDAVLKIRLE